MTRLTDVTRYPVGSVKLCGELDPERPKTFCTRDDPNHQSDHEHEYTGRTWPREHGSGSR
ncbi:hypothetical protein [Streptomyces sp.]|uniref:hypothetical protein n=1 Tax=Streptomyces sp. TaxID=1931 RepID=UPI002D7A1A53|nr:hypothetical protein [Streptomyces sp.]HET6356108.1 hypothetical protein [Streptomyces sp.]